jgi:hypothetical protein
MRWLTISKRYLPMLSAAIAKSDARFVWEAQAVLRFEIESESLPSSRTAILSHGEPDSGSWEPLCVLLGLAEPVQAFLLELHEP